MDGLKKCCYWCKHFGKCVIPIAERKVDFTDGPTKGKCPCENFAWNATAKSYNYKKKK